MQQRDASPGPKKMSISSKLDRKLSQPRELTSKQDQEEEPFKDLQPIEVQDVNIGSINANRRSSRLYSNLPNEDAPKLNESEQALFDEEIEEVEGKTQSKIKYQLNHRNAGRCSRIFYVYANKLIDSVVMAKGVMNEKMIEDMNYKDDDDEVMNERFHTIFDRNIASWKRNHPNEASPNERDMYLITRNAIFGALRSKFMFTMFLCLLAELAAVFYSWYIIEITAWILDADAPLQEGIIKISIFSSAVLFSAILRNAYIYQGFRMSICIRKVLVAAIYDKVAKLTIKALAQTNSGKLITLISSDIFMVERGLAFAPFAFCSPIISGAGYVTIGITAGWPYAVSTALIWITTMLLQTWTASTQKKWKQSEGSINDARLKIVSDMITGIRTIKAYAWENHYLEKLKTQRQKQMKYVYAINIIVSLGFSFFQNMGLVAAMFIFIPKWYRGEEIKMADSFGMLAMIFYLFYSINSITYYSMQTMFTFLGVTQRLSKVFGLEEHENFRDENVTRDEVCVKLTDSAYTWGFNSSKPKLITNNLALFDKVEDPVLSEMTFDLASDSLLVVVGKIGSGKTTLLHSIMDETVKLSGEQVVKGKIAYVEQEPFIFSASIEDNITFGLKYSEMRFKRAVVGAALISDLQNFARGWKTVIGERGINISGGQKARISLARAIYQDADIYLLDDPLSAVDPAVANEIFNKGVLTALKHKCVILVTHQLQFLRRSPHILLLKDGKQCSLGNFDEITAQGFDIDEILKQYGEMGKGGKNDGDKEVIPLTVAEQLKKEEADYNIKEKRKLKKKESILLIRSATKIIANQQLISDAAEKSKDTGSTAKKESTAINLIAPEQKIEGTITFKDYRAFFSYSAGMCGMITLLLVSLLCSVGQLLPSYWLAEWTKQGLEEQQKNFYPVTLTIMISVFIVIMFLRGLFLFYLILSATTNMHNKMAERVLRAKILFFDSNPVGRILTRFSKDLVVFDLMAPMLSVMALQGILKSIMTTIMVCIINPWLIIFLFFALWFMIHTFKDGIVVMSETQRLDSIYRGPIHNTMTMIINGLVTVRASDKIAFFKQEFMQNLELSSNATFCNVLANRWISIRFDLMVGLFITVTSAFCVFLKGRIEPELLTLTLQIIIDVMFFFAISLRMAAEIDNFMTSFQRIQEYTELDLEDDLVKEEDQKLKLNNWPQGGKIEYSNASMRYRQELEPSLNQLSFKVQPGMVIGVVGRTGSGKSSILQTLFRLVELEEGTTKIDGIDIKGVGLHMLRSHIAYIPQSPFLLQGTIRENLDPFNEMTDLQIYQIIEEVNLKEKIDSLKDGIDSYCSESSSLFSVGQKQLVCLARAIIRNTKILVLDEATANVDLETDNFIQRTLRERFQDCTVLIVAHRLATIIDSDRILVMKDGHMCEFNHPYRLLVEKDGDQSITNHRSHFARMVLSTGEDNAHSLFEIAEQTFQNNNKYEEETKNTLTITDNRTGKQYELDIRDDSIIATQLLQIKSSAGVVTRCFDPAYMNTVNCVSKISFIDGDKGILEYRGIPINQLAEHSSLMEVAFLLVYGELPSQKQLKNFDMRIRGNYAPNPKLNAFIEAFVKTQRHAHPMGMLQTLIACLSSFYPEANPAYSGGQFGYKTQVERDVHIHRVLGCAPAIAAAVFRVHNGEEIILPDPKLDYVSNFMYMIFGPNHRIGSNPKIIKAMEQLMILHAEHELNCSTAAVRHMTSSLADVYTSLGGSVTALYGPRHGGANEAVLKMLTEIGTVQNIPDFIEKVKQKKRVLMGFGHRVYKNFDPRAKLVRGIAEEVFKITGRENLIDIASELEKIALSDQYFISRKLYPNVDFYSGVIYKAIGFPPEYFTVLFALPRFAGWLAHWNEFIQDPDNKIVRPRQIYKGERSRDYVPMNGRAREDQADYLLEVEHSVASVMEETEQEEADDSYDQFGLPILQNRTKKQTVFVPTVAREVPVPSQVNQRENGSYQKASNGKTSTPDKVF